MIIHLNEHRFSKLFLTESKNSKRAKRQTREVIARFYDEDPNSDFVVNFEETLEKKFFGEGKRVDWFIVLEPNLASWLFEKPGSDLEKFFDYIFKKATTFKKPSEYIAKVKTMETFEQLKQFVIPQMEEDKAKKMEEMKKMGINLNRNYKVLGPLSYEEAKKYGNYSGLEFGASGRICYTQSYDTWNSPNYSDNGNNSCYLLLRNNWRTVTSEHDGSEKNNDLGELSKYNGYDDYGLSMIFVWITPEGGLHECNTRWNHRAIYAPGHGVDSAMNELDIAKLMGAPFNKVFNVSTVDEKHAELNKIVEQKLAENGHNLNAVFEDVADTFGNGIFVKYNKKWNLLDTETKSKILLPIWFNDVVRAFDNFYYIRANGKPNILTNECKYLWNHPISEWFDNISILNEEAPYLVVKKNNKFNFLSWETGELLYNGTWFDGIDETRWRKFGTDLVYCPVWVGEGSRRRYNLLAYTGVLLWPYAHDEWFNECWIFENNEYLVVGIDGKYNVVAPDGKFMFNAPIKEWFDYIEGNPFNHGGVPFAFVGKMAEDKNEDGRFMEFFKYNLLKKDGTLLSNDWFKAFVSEDLDFFGREGGNYCRVKNDEGKYNLLNVNGELVWKGEEWFEKISSPNMFGVCLVKQTTSDGRLYNVLVGNKGTLVSDTWFKYAVSGSRGFQLANDTTSKVLFVSGKGEVSS